MPLFVGEQGGGGGIPSANIGLAYPTVAALEAEPGPAAQRFAYVAEFDAWYEWIPASGATVDHFGILGHTGGAAGVWILLANRLLVEAIGSGNDDAARLNAAFVASSGTFEIHLTNNNGQFEIISAPIVMHTKSTLVGRQDVVLHSQIVDIGQPTNAPLVIEPGPVVGNTTLASDVTLGGVALVVTNATAAGIVVGSTILLQSGGGTGLQAMSYVVVTRSGNNLTVDRPVLYPFKAADTIARYANFANNVRILGNGMRVTGSGDRLFEGAICWDGLVDSVRFDGTVGDLVASFDTGGYRNTFNRCTVNGHSTATVGLALESNEASKIVDCEAHDVSISAISLYDTVSCEVLRGRGYRCASGITLTSDGNGSAQQPNFNCADTRIAGGAYIDNSTTGIELAFADRTTVSGVESRYNATGCSVGAPSTAANDNKIIGCDFSSNATYALTVADLSTGTRLSHTDCSGDAASYAINTSAELDLDGVIVLGAVGAKQAVICNSGSYRVTVRGCIFRSQANTTVLATAFLIGAGVECVVTQSKLQVTTSGTEAIYVLGLLRISSTKIEQIQNANNVIGVYSAAAGATISFGEENDFSACTTPSRFDAGNRPTHAAEIRVADQGPTVVGGILTRYLGENGSAALTPDAVAVTIGRTTTFRDLVGTLSAAPGATHNNVYTVQRKPLGSAVWSNTSLSITFGAADVRQSLDATPPNVANVVFSPGDQLVVKEVLDGALNASADPRMLVVGF